MVIVEGLVENLLSSRLIHTMAIRYRRSHIAVGSRRSRFRVLVEDISRSAALTGTTPTGTVAPLLAPNDGWLMLNNCVDGHLALRSFHLTCGLVW